MHMHVAVLLLVPIVAPATSILVVVLQLVMLGANCEFAQFINCAAQFMNS